MFCRIRAKTRFASTRSSLRKRRITHSCRPLVRRNRSGGHGASEDRRLQRYYFGAPRPESRGIMDNLSSMSVFMHAAETRSFTKAGSKLGVSSSAIGKTIARLEERLGVRLFHR